VPEGGKNRPREQCREEQGGLDTCPTLFVSHWELTQKRLRSHWVLLLGWNYLFRLQILSRENTQRVHPESGALSGMGRSSPWGKSKPQGRQLFSHRTGQVYALLSNLGHFLEGCRDPGTVLCHRASDIIESEKLQIVKGSEGLKEDEHFLHTHPPCMI